MSVLLLTMGPQLGLVMETPVLRVGEPGTIKFHATGAVGPVKWSVVESDLPAEWGAITPDGAEATISTAEALEWGEYTITVRAVDSQRAPVARTFSVRVAPDAIVVNGGGPFDWIHNVPVNESLPVSGGTGVYTSVETAGSPLPSGLSATIAGASVLLSGTPIGVSSGVTQIIVRDSEGAAGQASIVFEVADPPKIWIAGSFTTVSGVARSRVARLLPSGDLDTLVGDALVTSGVVNDVAVLGDGSALLVGLFSSAGGSTHQNIAKIASDGSVDHGFSPSANNSIYTVTTQDDGKILIGGDFTTVNGISRQRIARLNPDGSLDTGFNPGANGIVRRIIVQPDGTILVAGQQTTLAGASKPYISRLNSDGTDDTTFVVASPNSQVRDIALQSDGRIVIGGLSFTTVGGVARQRLARLNPDGTLDTGFNPGANGEVHRIVLQPDGYMLIAGNYSTIAGTSRSRLARLSSAGVFDSSFMPGTISAQVHGIAVQPDGQIVVGGIFTSIAGITRNRVARLNADGSLDTGFDPDCNGASGVVVLA